METTTSCPVCSSRRPFLTDNRVSCLQRVGTSFARFTELTIFHSPRTLHSSRWRVNTGSTRAERTSRFFVFRRNAYGHRGKRTLSRLAPFVASYYWINRFFVSRYDRFTVRTTKFVRCFVAIRSVTRGGETFVYKRRPYGKRAGLEGCARV